MSEQQIPGFIGKPRVKRLVCDWLEPEEGAQPFEAMVDVKMSIEAVDEFGRLLANEPSFAQLWEVLTPRVRQWNAVALDLATGTYEPVPPPAEAGEDAFRVVDPVITTWLAFALKSAALGGDLGKEPTRSGSTPEPVSANGSGSGPRPKTSRRNPTGSGGRSGTT